MANDNGGNPQRDLGRPEDNPFIAFRRFADSQVSSLFNTVRTLPATIVSYNHVNQAREQCLFGKADEKKCEKLHELEIEAMARQLEVRELFREGNLHAVLRNSNDLFRLGEQADLIRLEIIEEATKNGELLPNGHNKSELVERVASQKGRDWGAEWDWDIPQPFYSGRKATSDSNESERDRIMQKWEEISQLQSQVQRLMASFDRSVGDDGPTGLTRSHSSPEISDQSSNAQGRSWALSWQWPPPADSTRNNPGSYSPRVLEDDKELERAGVDWRKAYEDLMREEEIGRHHRSRSEHTFHDKASYEYSRDHEDQHEEATSPNTSYTFPTLEQRLQWGSHADKTNEACRRNHEEREESEMDVYEQLAVGYDNPRSSMPLSAMAHSNSKPSVLSTLTTTERTVAPDGSVTIKVVLKKRFADGREESSETVHTQKGQEGNTTSQYPWDTPDQSQTKTRTRNGWFWSN